MTTLRDRIAATVESRYGVCPPEFVDAILALLRDEAPPSDEELRAICDESFATGNQRQALVELGHARGIASGEAERAELQRLLECAQKRIGELDGALHSKLMSLPLEQLQQAERERDAAREELRETRGPLEWVPFDLEEFPEGNTALLRFVGADGADYYFVDRITWDSESPPQWGECSAGVEFDAVTHYALFNQLEAEARKAGAP
jgi:hypothetical protein